MAEFHGQGVLNRGQLTAGRDLNIGVASRNSDPLLKVRSTDPRDDKARIEQQKGGLLRDSYKWILSHEEFLKWRDSEGYQLLWVRGDPGKGKTMLLCGIVDELNRRRKHNWNIAYFFCQGTNYKLRKASFVLQGLIFSLLSQQDELLDCVREDIEQASGEMFRDLNGWIALCRIFGRLVEEMERRQQITYLIVDGLDECSEDRRHLLKWIAALSAPSIKLLISSRNWPLIEDGLSGATQKLLLPLELNDQSISAAVDHYIDHKVIELEISKGLRSEPREAIRRHLKSFSNNTFLWVALVCEELGREDTYPWEVLDMVHEFPPGLDELYERMAAHFLASKDAKICCQVLFVQTLAYRPLTLAELLSIAMLPKKFVESWLQKIVELCGSFLTVKNNTVYFVHQSAKDYLIKSMPNSLFPLGRLAAGHHAMAIQAIQALAETLRENMYELPSLGSRVDDFNAPDPDPLGGIRYACMYWVDHMIDAGLLEKENVEDGDLVYRFLEKHLLHWFEALSLLKSLGVGIKALRRTLFQLQIGTRAPSSEEHGRAPGAHSKRREARPSMGGSLGSGRMQALQDLIYDAWRVLRLHKVGIETAPLQVYTSALIFSPTQSLVRQIFLKKPEWLLMTPTAESYWDSTWLQTLEGHGDIKCVSFAPDARHAASGSNDGVARIWDVTTGECLNILKGHKGEIDSIAFSIDGLRLASSSADCTTRIWDTQSGACLQTLECGTSDPDESRSKLVAFFDASNIISADVYATICRWNITTGECRTTWQRDAEVRALDLSHSGTRAAWAVDNIRYTGRIVAVDTVAGQYHKTPWYQEVYMNPKRAVSIAMSPDGEYVAMTQDRLARVWRLATNEYKYLHIPLLYPCLNSLATAMSPDNRYLAVAIHYHLWECNIATGQFVELAGGRYHRHSSILALAYSPDSSLLLVGEKDGAVQILETTAVRLQQEMPKLRNGDTPFELTLSPDGAFLAMGHVQFQVWDLVKKRMNKIILPTNGVSATFSPGNKYLACTGIEWRDSAFERVSELFDTATGRCLWKKTKRNEPKNHTSIARWSFLADGIRVALLSPLLESSLKIQILDAATGNTLSTDTLSIGGYRSVTAISHDGKHLAQGLRDSTDHIYIWDVAAGTRICSVNLPTYYVAHDAHLKFSLDDRYVILYARNTDLTCLADVAKGTLLKTVKGLHPFKPGFADLQTQRGNLDINQVLLHDYEDPISYGDDSAYLKKPLPGIGITAARDWILKNGEPYLWLPPQHRVSSLGQIQIAGNTIVLFNGPDEVYCFRFDSPSRARC